MERVPLHGLAVQLFRSIARYISLNLITQNVNRTHARTRLFANSIIWAMEYYSKHKQDKMANVLNTKSLFVLGVI